MRCAAELGVILKMISRIFSTLNVAAVVFFIVLVILAAPSFFDPTFEIVNKSTTPVFVVAEWLNKEKTVGNLEPASTYEFSLSNEAAMTFRVSYSGGREIESEPIYFTRGTKVIATITIDAVKVIYDHEIE